MLEFGREILGHPEAALRREWLVTNGLGGYAMGSLLANAPTRRYHGLLIAALQPPVGRQLLVGGLEILAGYGGETYELSAFEATDRSLDDGYRQLEHWRLAGTVPTARFACAEALVEQQIWMEHGANTTYVRFTHSRGAEPLTLRLQPMITNRDHHYPSLEPTWRPAISAVERGAAVELGKGRRLLLLADGAAWATDGENWLDGVYHRAEDERGYDAEERLLLAGCFRATLQPGASLTLVFSTEQAPDLDGAAALAREQERFRELLRQANLPASAPRWIVQLVLAADQFIVRRDVTLPDGTIAAGHSVIAGYPWFSDWGRDTMIALPGLLLATGRAGIAVSVLRTFSRFVSQGMLPNRFPDAGEAPEYNTVDATLWFFQAIRAVYRATGDQTLLADLCPVLEEIIDWHRRGTRYGIKVAADGLLAAGEPTVQLTWMDAKYQDWVVTPREGKAVEINALWHSALLTLAEFARELGRPGADELEAEAARVRSAFERFWNPERGYLFDVLDGPGGDDPALRPNQLFAVSVAHPPLEGERAAAVVQACARHLWASYGLRSLAPDDPQYLGDYGGDLKTRDGAYHQGTAWGWLIGPFAGAYARLHGAEAARAWLEPMADHLGDAGIGSISEIFDGDAPFAPRGCPWQAWSVAEVLRCWLESSAGSRQSSGEA
ncbi:MAG TPA: amylo-alpha-1,6-glucosidase [Herpetosiphonaceae bacterium]